MEEQLYSKSADWDTGIINYISRANSIEEIDSSALLEELQAQIAGAKLYSNGEVYFQITTHIKPLLSSDVSYGNKVIECPIYQG